MTQSRGRRRSGNPRDGPTSSQQRSAGGRAGAPGGPLCGLRGNLPRFRQPAAARPAPSIWGSCSSSSRAWRRRHRAGLPNVGLPGPPPRENFNGGEDDRRLAAGQPNRHAPPPEMTGRRRVSWPRRNGCKTRPPERIISAAVMSRASRSVRRQRRANMTARQRGWVRGAGQLESRWAAYCVFSNVGSSHMKVRAGRSWAFVPRRHWPDARLGHARNNIVHVRGQPCVAGPRSRGMPRSTRVVGSARPPDAPRGRARPQDPECSGGIYLGACAVRGRVRTRVLAATHCSAGRRSSGQRTSPCNGGRRGGPRDARASSRLGGAPPVSSLSVAAPGSSPHRRAAAPSARGTRRQRLSPGTRASRRYRRGGAASRA